MSENPRLSATAFYALVLDRIEDAEPYDDRMSSPDDVRLHPDGE